MSRKYAISIVTFSLWYALYEDPYTPLRLFKCEYPRYTWEQGDPLQMQVPTPAGNLLINL